MEVSTILNEVKLARVYQYFQDGDMPVGIITAFRGENDAELNTRLNKQLAATLRNKKFGYSWVDGAWVENQGTPEEVHVSEVSILVAASPGRDDELFKALVDGAQKYNQDAFVFKRGDSDKIGIYDKTGKLDMEFSKARIDKLGDIYTKMRGGQHGGRSFIFEGVRDSPGFIARLAGMTD